MKKHLILLRGVPGCGKSTVAEYLAPMGDLDKFLMAPICCADDYFMVDGEYKWSPTKLGWAHAQCQGKCEQAMIDDETRIIVSNTNTTEKEMKAYYEMAEKYGYMVFSLVVENRHGGTDVHNVPDASKDAMVKRFSIKLK